MHLDFELTRITCAFIYIDLDIRREREKRKKEKFISRVDLNEKKVDSI